MKALKRKLFLSVASLAVCAATLVSTTFAWYVSNTTAEVQRVSGSTAGAGTDGNLLVAQDKGPDTTEELLSWGQYIAEVTPSVNTQLNPTTKATAAASGVEVGDWVDKEGKLIAAADAASGQPYLQFEFWVLSTGEQEEVTIEYTLTNTTTDLTPQKVYNTTGAPSSLALGDTFTSDACRALRMDVFTSTLLDVTTLTPIGNAKNIELDKAATGYQTKTGCVDTGNAGTYYKQIVNKIGYGTNGTSGASTDSGLKAWTSFAISPNTPLKLTFRIWLDGTDVNCFDSCVGQTFALKFNLSVSD